MRTPCVGRTVRWTAVSGAGLDVTSYREDQTDSDVLKLREYLDEKIIDIGFAHLIKVDAT